MLLGLALAANLRGIRMAGWVQTVVTYTVLAGTSVLSVVALFHVGHAFDQPFDLFGRGAFSGVQAIAFALFLYAAFEWVTTTAEEARTPKVITRALFIAPLLIWGVSTLFVLALAHLVPFSVLHHSAYPQLLMGRAALGTVGELWMLALTVLTALNTFNGGFLVASRFIYAAARETRCPARSPSSTSTPCRGWPCASWPVCRPSWPPWCSPPDSGSCWWPSGRRSSRPSTRSDPCAS